MNARPKRSRGIVLTVLVLLSTLITAAQNPVPKHGRVFIEYGLEPERTIPNKIRPRAPIWQTPRINVPALRRSLQLFRKAGGIMFDNVAQPCDDLVNARLQLSYDANQPDGNRLTLHVGNHAYSVIGIHDNDLRPIATFVDSKVPILTNLQLPDEQIYDYCAVPSPGLRIVTLHPAFLDTHLGWLSISMDSIPWSFSRAERWTKEGQLPDATRPLAKSLAIALRSDEGEYARKWPEVRASFFNNGRKVLLELSKDEQRHYLNLVKARTDRGRGGAYYQERLGQHTSATL